ncbi:helix-turn-helix domain-containing protein [Arthrobacter sp. HLT1-20]
MNNSVSAADAAALFDGGRLTLARQLAGIRKSELAHRISKSATALAGWETGAKRPASSTVAELALSLGVDPGFFAVRQDDVAMLSGTPHFRSLRSTTQITRDQATAYGQLAVDVSLSLEHHVELPHADIPSYPVAPEDIEDASPEEAARFVRQQWQLDPGPVGHLVRLVENRGVLVVFSPPGTASVDAYSFDSYARPVVVLNPTKRDYYRQRFDVAHELGHLVMHGDAEPGGRIIEEQANRFAAEFLMPESDIRDSLPKTMGRTVWTTLGKLKEQYGVSMQALLFRSRRLGQLGDVSYRNAMTTVSARGWRRHEPGVINTVEQPSLLAKAVEILDEVGITERILVSQCRVPAELYRQVVSRAPLESHLETTPILDERQSRSTTVVSLMDRFKMTES